MCWDENPLGVWLVVSERSHLKGKKQASSLMSASETRTPPLQVSICCCCCWSSLSSLLLITFSSSCLACIHRSSLFQPQLICPTWAKSSPRGKKRKGKIVQSCFFFFFLECLFTAAGKCALIEAERTMVRQCVLLWQSSPLGHSCACWGWLLLQLGYCAIRPGHSLHAGFFFSNQTTSVWWMDAGLDELQDVCV